MAATEFLTEARLRGAKPKSACQARKLPQCAPGGTRSRAERRAERDSRSNTFESIAREWLAKQPFAPKTMKKALWTFEDLLFPYIGARPISALTAPKLLGVFRRLERRGKHETAHRAKQRGRAERDPTADLRGALAPVTVTNRAAITIIELQLTHQERNEVRAAHNRAQRLTERQKMMRAWADYLESLRTGANVVLLRRPA